MVNMNVSNSTTTDFTNTVDDVSIPNVSLDYANTGKATTTWTFDEAREHFGYYKTIPELAGAIDLLGVWVAGKGYETDAYTKTELEHISGWGEDTFQSIIQNMIVVKKIVGDAFCEIIRQDGQLINLKPISPERVRIVITSAGRIQKYEVKVGAKWKSFKTADILHISNDRTADEIHGTSIMNVCKWTIDALKEALDDERLIKHRDKALGIVRYKTDNTGKISTVNEAIQKAINKGEMLGIPEGSADIDPWPTKNDGNRMEWIRYLENRFYIAVKVPRVMATSDGFTEAGGKVGFLTFEPAYTSEQTLLEADLWNQLGIKIKFNRPPTLSGVLQQDEAKNTGQVAIQPNDATATANTENG